jgi:hypothetical protein
MLGVRAPLYVPGASDPPLSFYIDWQETLAGSG